MAKATKPGSVTISMGSFQRFRLMEMASERSKTSKNFLESLKWSKVTSPMKFGDEESKLLSYVENEKNGTAAVVGLNRIVDKDIEFSIEGAALLLTVIKEAVGLPVGEAEQIAPIYEALGGER